MGYDFEKERNEAIDAGERALTSLRAARGELQSAGNWGLLDLFGGGMISGLVKHSKMGNAQKYMEEAKYNLQSFSRELQDVNMTHNLIVETLYLIFDYPYKYYTFKLFEV